MPSIAIQVSFTPQPSSVASNAIVIDDPLGSSSPSVGPVIATVGASASATAS